MKTLSVEDLAAVEAAVEAAVRLGERAVFANVSDEPIRIFEVAWAGRSVAQMVFDPGDAYPSVTMAFQVRPDSAGANYVTWPMIVGKTIAETLAVKTGTVLVLLPPSGDPWSVNPSGPWVLR